MSSFPAIRRFEEKREKNQHLADIFNQAKSQLDIAKTRPHSYSPGSPIVAALPWRTQAVPLHVLVVVLLGDCVGG